MTFTDAETEILQESVVKKAVVKLIQQASEDLGQAVLSKRSNDPALILAKAEYEGAQAILRRVQARLGMV